MSRPGIDLASFQGLPGNWRTHAGEYDWAAVKITEHKPDGETYLNPDAAADWAFLKQQGKGRIAYTFGHPGSSPDVTTAAFLAELERLGLHDDDGVALDLEVSDGRSPASVDAWGLRVQTTLHKALDRLPVTYSFLSFIEAGNCRSLGWTPLWIADPSSPMGRPRVPSPWKAHAIHQYAITGSIDRDLANYRTGAEMTDALGKPAAHHKDTEVIEANGSDSWADIARKHGIASAFLIRLNCRDGKPFTPGVREYINGLRLDLPVPLKTRIRVPVKRP